MVYKSGLTKAEKAALAKAAQEGTLPAGMSYDPATGTITVTADDIEALSRIAQAETGVIGAPIDDKVASVLGVVANRASTVPNVAYGNVPGMYGQTQIQSVVNEPYAFSPVNKPGTWEGVPDANPAYDQATAFGIGNMNAAIAAGQQPTEFGAATDFLNPHPAAYPGAPLAAARAARTAASMQDPTKIGYGSLSHVVGVTPGSPPAQPITGVQLAPGALGAFPEMMAGQVPVEAQTSPDIIGGMYQGLDPAESLDWSGRAQAAQFGQPEMVGQEPVDQQVGSFIAGLPGEVAQTTVIDPANFASRMAQLGLSKLGLADAPVAATPAPAVPALGLPATEQPSQYSPMPASGVPEIAAGALGPPVGDYNNPAFGVQQRAYNPQLDMAAPPAAPSVAPIGITPPSMDVAVATPPAAPAPAPVAQQQALDAIVAAAPNQPVTRAPVTQQQSLDAIVGAAPNQPVDPLAGTVPVEAVPSQPVLEGYGPPSVSIATVAKPAAPEATLNPMDMSHIGPLDLAQPQLSMEAPAAPQQPVAAPVAPAARPSIQPNTNVGLATSFPTPSYSYGFPSTPPGVAMDTVPAFEAPQTMEAPAPAPTISAPTITPARPTVARPAAPTYSPVAPATTAPPSVAAPTLSGGPFGYGYAPGGAPAINPAGDTQTFSLGPEERNSSAYGINTGGPLGNAAGTYKSPALSDAFQGVLGPIGHALGMPSAPSLAGAQPLSAGYSQPAGYGFSAPGTNPYGYSGYSDPLGALASGYGDTYGGAFGPSDSYGGFGGTIGGGYGPSDPSGYGGGEGGGYGGGGYGGEGGSEGGGYGGRGSGYGSEGGYGGNSGLMAGPTMDVDPRKRKHPLLSFLGL